MSLTKELTNSINTWVNSKMSEAVFDPKKGYYPFSIIADAYAKGVEFGEKNLEKKIKETFQQNVEIVSSQIDSSLMELKKDNLVPTKLFLKLGLKESRIVFCFSEEIYFSDKFMDKAYVLASDVRSLSHDQGILLSLGYLADNSNINFEDLKSDGFGIGVDLHTKKAIY